MEASFLEPRRPRPRRRRPARLDHPHLGDRRRRDVRRVTCSNGSGSGVLVPGDRRDPQQHAGRGGPQPARLPPDRARAAGAVDDGADRGPARRRDRARARQRRLQPDPLGDPADRGAGGRAGAGRWRGGRGAAPALRGGRRPGRAGDRRGGAGADRGARRRRSPAARRSTSSSAASRRSPATRRPARSAAAATPAAAAPSPTPDRALVPLYALRNKEPRVPTARMAPMAGTRDRLRGRGAARRPRGRRRARRGCELLEQLAAEGVPLEELRDAVAAGRLALLPVERAIAGDGPRYTAREVAEIGRHRPRAAAALHAPRSASPTPTPTSAR